MKKSLWLLFAAVIASCLFAACEETSEVNEYANWRERNQRFIDSIAAVAEENVDGNWRIYKSLTLPPDNPNELAQAKDVNDYVYCHIEQSGTGTTSPIYTDSIRASYRMWLINGTMLDQSFRGEFNPSFSVPAKFAMKSTIVGWTTAMQQMHVGDTWTIYIPYPLGYGTRKNGDIPGYSALKYWVNLAGIYPTGTVVPEWQ